MHESRRDSARVISRETVNAELDRNFPHRGKGTSSHNSRVTKQLEDTERGKFNEVCRRVPPSSKVFQRNEARNTGAGIDERSSCWIFGTRFGLTVFKIVTSHLDARRSSFLPLANEDIISDSLPLLHASLGPVAFRNDPRNDPFHREGTRSEPKGRNQSAIANHRHGFVYAIGPFSNNSIFE